MTTWMRCYWAEDDVWFYFEVDAEGWVTRQVELEGPELTPVVAASLAEWQRARDAGRLAEYDSRFGTTAELPKSMKVTPKSALRVTVPVTRSSSWTILKKAGTRSLCVASVRQWACSAPPPSGTTAVRRGAQRLWSCRWRSAAASARPAPAARPAGPAASTTKPPTHRRPPAGHA